MKMAVKELCLTQKQIDCYRTDGFLSPIRIFSNEEASRLRSELECFEAAHGLVMGTPYRNKPHLVMTWVAEVIRNARILDAVESILGPNLLVWGTNFFVKEPYDGTFISLHQDSTYWGLSRPEVLTVWVALSASYRSSGAMKMAPGSHKLEQLPHVDTFEKGNLLTRGQKVEHGVDENDIAWIDLAPGEASIHHVRIIHGSEPNSSSDRRIGLAIRFVRTDVKQVNGVKDYATLVRGRDDFQHFQHEPRPKETLGEVEVAVHKQIAEESFKLFYQGTGREPTFDQ